VGQGCLIRAAQPLVGQDVMRRRRPVRHEADLLRGPAKLCQAFGINGALSGTDLCGGGVLQFHDDGTRAPVTEGPRVGVTLAADLPWRFFVPGSRWVSSYRRSPRAPQPA
jgi:DNA-3-methyladenine glycosylase